MNTWANLHLLGQPNTFLAAEVNMMNKVRHPNVVLLMGICSTPPHLSIITCGPRPPNQQTHP
jgi:hypothetical protein